MAERKRARKKQGFVNRFWLEDKLRRRRGGTSWTRERKSKEYAPDVSAHESGAQAEAICARVQVLTVDLYWSCGWFHDFACP